MDTVEVVAAIIINDGKILCTQRSIDDPYLALKWEFPGGKIEHNESHIQALKREIKEELNADIEVNDFFMTVKHQYAHFHLTMHTYICELKESSLNLNEHHQYQWLYPNQLEKLEWVEADIKVISILEGSDKI